MPETEFGVNRPEQAQKRGYSKESPLPGRQKGIAPPGTRRYFPHPRMREGIV